MKDLLDCIKALQNGELKDLVDARLKEFEEVGRGSSKRIFKELCFCILTANCAAEMCIRVQNEIEDEFLTLPEEKLAKRLKEVKYRFYNKRANYIEASRNYMDDLKEIIDSQEDERILRDWLVKNIKGIGYKEASHFLRNIGFKNLAIIDFHIVDVLVKHELIDDRPKALSKTRYLKIEDTLEKLAKSMNMSLGELDLYLWYLETGKILK